MASPSVTQSVAASVIGGTSKTFTGPALTSTDVVVVVALAESNSAASAPNVTGITATGLAFSKRSVAAHVVACGKVYSVETWLAPLGPGDGSGSFSGNITVDWDATLDGGYLVCFGVAGVAVNDPPSFDPNAGLPYWAGDAANPPTIRYSTDNPDDLLIAVYATDSMSGYGPTPGSWVGVNGGHVWPTNYVSLGVSVLAVSAAQAAVDVAIGMEGILFVDGFTADAPETPAVDLADAFGDESVLTAQITITPRPLELTAAFGEDAAFGAAITLLPVPLDLAAELADDAALALYLTIGLAALRLAADFADDAGLTARATLLAAIALTVTFTDGAELAAPVTIGFEPHAPPIQVVVVLSW